MCLLHKWGRLIKTERPRRHRAAQTHVWTQIQPWVTGHLPYMCEALGLMPLPLPQIKSSHYSSLVPKFCHQFCHLNWPSLSLSERWGTLRLKEKIFLGMRTLFLLKFSNVQGRRTTWRRPKTMMNYHQLHTCPFLPFLHKHRCEVNRRIVVGARHTSTACCPSIHWLRGSFLFSSFLPAGGLTTLPGQEKLLLVSQVAETTAVCHYTQVCANLYIT